MKEVRIHARAGQGAITTGALLGAAAFAKGRYALAFPSFGAARMGAPMNAFVRVSDKEIRLRSQVDEPDYLLVMDPTLMRGFDVYAGARDGGIAIINQKEHVDPPAHAKGVKTYSVPGNDIAQEVMGRPLGNTAILGAFAAATNEIDLPSLEKVIRERFGGKGKAAEQNIEAARRGFEYMKGLLKKNGG
jgi:pyruvate ferredoxin oxidoreductase gamma subunit